MVNSTEQRVEAFHSLGESINKTLSGVSDPETARLRRVISSYHNINSWFTPENVRAALSAWAELLCRDNLLKWLGRYPDLEYEGAPATILTIMAGNIPMVGFHDALSVLISGDRLVIKSSSKDPLLPCELLIMLCRVEPSFSDMISFGGNIRDAGSYDAVLATGSDNSARHFSYLFGGLPMLIRRNRTSAAVLTGGETEVEMAALGNDIFRYFGLGCRSVTHLFLYEGYDTGTLSEAFPGQSHIAGHKGYMQNYYYNRALMKMSRQTFTDNHFFILRESDSLFPPVSVLNYQFIKSGDIEKTIEKNRSRLQAVSGRGYTPFGKSQNPDLWDYSDNLDTIRFLLDLKKRG